MEKLVNEFKILITFLLFIISSPLYCQQIITQTDIITLNGVIVDKLGEPLVGVNVFINGTTIGGVTDVNGKFQLKVSKGSKITISFIGYTTKNFDIQEYSNIRVNFDEGLIEFCCTNHTPGHCAKTISEMQNLTKKNNCSFK